MKIKIILIHAAAAILLLFMPITAQAGPDNSISPPTYGTSNPRHFFLLIGISQYQYLPRMQAPANNAKLLAESLLHTKGVAEISLLTDQAATKANIGAELQKYKQTMTPADTLLIYYSGHGGLATLTYQSELRSSLGNQRLDKNIYDEALMPVDAYYTADKQITYRELSELLKSLPSNKITLVVDSSYDRMTLPVLTPSYEPAKTVQRPRSTIRDINIFGYSVIMASDWQEMAWDDRFTGKPYGIFTYFLAQGLQSRSIDLNQDGRVSVRELFEFTRMNTLSYNGMQHPQFYRGRDTEMIIYEFK
jgi:hypothetical protein